MTRFRAETKPDSAFVHINAGGEVSNHKDEPKQSHYRQGWRADYEAGKRAATRDLRAAIIEALGLDERYLRQPED